MKVNAMALKRGNVIEDQSYPEGLLRVDEVSGVGESVIKVRYTNLMTGVQGWGFMGALAQINIQELTNVTSEEGR